MVGEAYNTPPTRVLSACWPAGAGASNLAKAVVAATQKPADFKLLYEVTLPIEEKIRRICQQIYRADDIEILRKFVCTYTCMQAFSE